MSAITDEKKQEYLEFAKELAGEAGEILRKYFEADVSVEDKSDGSPVTIADTTVNRVVIEKIEAKYPDHTVIGEEESNGRYGMGLRWICDPLDGTQSFIWGIPVFTFGIALVEDGRPVVSAIYNPMTDKMFAASVGGGAYCNDKKLQVNSNSISGAAIVSDIKLRHSWQSDGNFTNEVEELGAKMSTQYIGGLSKYSTVATGRLSGYINLGTSSHDVAPAELIITEAGGRVTDIDGKQLMYLQKKIDAIGSNGVIHKDLLSMVQAARANEGEKQ